jgi:hypothetical protein
MKPSESLEGSFMGSEESNLFDMAEQIDQEDASVEDSYSFEKAFFGTDFETLSQLKHRANETSTHRVKHSIGDILNESNYDLSTALEGLLIAKSSKSSSNYNGNNSSSPCGAAGPLTMWKSFTRSVVEVMGKMEKMADSAVDGAASMQRNDSEDDYTRYTSFDEFDEAGQIRRLGSWNTLETTTTAHSMATDITSMSKLGQVVYDDDGNQIPEALVDLTRKKRIQQNKKKKKKRVVKFDYPPIKSLKECPRHDPEDLPKLFFTEEELNQIEDDRLNTNVADDVEVVCVVSSSESFESQAQDTDEATLPQETSDTSNLDDVEGSKNNILKHEDGECTPSMSNTRRSRLFRRSPLPSKSPTAFAKSPKVSTESSMEDNHNSQEDSKPTILLSPNKRLISSVHILMRERSLATRR